MKFYKNLLLFCTVTLLFAACGQADEKSTLLHPVVKDGKWGYINNQGKIIIVPQFENAFRFSEGLAAVKDSSDKWKYIDSTGKVVVTPENLSINLGGDFHDGIAVVRDSTGYSLIDKSGKSPFPSAFRPTDKSKFSEGLMLVSDLGGKFQIIDNKGNIVATPDFSDAGKDITVGKFRAVSPECFPKMPTTI